MSAMSRSAGLKPPQSKTLTAPRIPRETGFGDFCFGRILRSDRKKDRRWMWENPRNVLPNAYLENNKQFKTTDRFGEGKIALGEWTAEEFAANSHNTPCVELDGFERKGKFRFSSLPTEVRHTILRMLLAPLLIYDPISKHDFIQFSIENNEDPYDFMDMYFEAGIDDYLQRQDKFRKTRSYSSSDAGSEDESATHIYPEYPNYLDSLSPSEKSSAVERYEKLKKSYEWEMREHPTRSNPYTLSALVYKPTKDGKDRMGEIENRRRDKSHVFINETGIKAEEKQDFHMLALIQQLSNLSNAIRQDLGTVIWAHTKLHLFGDAAMTSGPLACLMERPGITQGISCISLDILGEPMDKRQKEFFNLTWRYISRHMKLEHLHINLCAHGYNSIDIDKLITHCQNSETFREAELLRSTTVSKSFVIRLVEEDADRWAPYGSRVKRAEALRRLSDYILPDTLRDLPAPQILTTIQDREGKSIKTILGQRSISGSTR